MKLGLTLSELESLIITVREERVILDADLARIYGVPTSRFNEAVKRNLGRFPADFILHLSKEEWTRIDALRSQNAILKTGRGKHRKYLPYVFTEHGAVMAANVLQSPRAIQMSVFVVRAFVKMRSAFSDSRDLARKLALLEQELKIRLNIHEAAIVDVLQRIMKILDPPPPPPEPPRPKSVSMSKKTRSHTESTAGSGKKHKTPLHMNDNRKGRRFFINPPLQRVVGPPSHPQILSCVSRPVLNNVNPCP